MRKRWACSVVAVLTVVGAAPALSSRLVNAVAARVDGRPIHYRDVLQEAKRLRVRDTLMRYRRGTSSPDREDDETGAAKARRQALQLVINRACLVEACRRRGISLRKDRLRRVLTARFLTAGDRWNQTPPYRISRYPELMRRRTRYSLLYYQTLSQRLSLGIRIGDEEMRTLFERYKQRGALKKPADVKVREIVVLKSALENGPAPLKRTLGAVNDRRGFDRLRARLRAEGGTAVTELTRRGGWLKLRYGTAFSQRLYRHGRTGLYPEPVASDRAYHLVWILEIRPPGLYTFEELRPRLMLNRFEYRFKRWLARERKTMTIKINKTLFPSI